MSEPKRGGPRRFDRDEFIVKSLEANPEWNTLEELRQRLLAEGWKSYPANDTSRSQLSTYELEISMRRLKRDHRLPKRPSKPKPEVPNVVLDAVADTPGWAKQDAQRIRAIVDLGLRVRLVNGLWEVVK